MLLLDDQIRKQNHQKQQNFYDLIIENSLRFGNGAEKTIRMDREGMWWGADTLVEITGVTPPTAIPGTAILLDGTIHAKDGATGVFTEHGGNTLTISKGIVTAIN